MTKKKESEFGKGCAYCLGLFLEHAERDWRLPPSSLIGDRDVDAEIWFNGASDHLYELQIPKTLGKRLKKRLRDFQKKCLEWGHGYTVKPTKEDKVWAIGEAAELLRLIDKSHKVETIEATWK